MFCVWILLLQFLSGGSAFFIHNSQHSLCLEDSGGTGQVLLKKCNLDSNLQQWTWISQDTLMCAETSRCLWARPGESVQTLDCHSQNSAVGFMWDCDRGRLVHRNTSMLLSVAEYHLVLRPHGKHSTWKSLDEGNLCQEKLRLKRASTVSEEFEVGQEQTEKLVVMTEEQRELLRWFYRTEDPTTWKFVLLGLAFVCLLFGFLLLGMGVMASKSRKKIAKYKAAISLIPKTEEVELKDVSSLSEKSTSEEAHSGNHFHVSKLDKGEFKAGSIMVKWKDGNTSCMYSGQAEGVDCDQEKKSEQKVIQEPEENPSQEEEPSQGEEQEKGKMKAQEEQDEAKASQSEACDEMMAED